MVLFDAESKPNRIYKPNQQYIIVYELFFKKNNFID